MAEPQTNLAVDGQEFAIADINSLGSVAGLAEDRVFSEWLRLSPFDGANTYKTILPYGFLAIEGLTPGNPTNYGTVQPTGSANGSVNVFPFRAVVGSRTSVGTSVLANWRDIRTAIFTGASAFSQTIALASNASGNPRWDLIYATVSVDTASGTQTRRVKSPTTGVVTSGTQTTALVNTVTVTVLQGTPGATPAIPALPSDSGSLYNIALAAVRVPNGFGAGTTIVNADIRDQVKISALQSPTTGVMRIRAASGNNDQAGTYDTDALGPGVWIPASAGQRPGPFLPPGLVGGEMVLVEVDLTMSAHPSHAVGSVVDDTIDWRSRFILAIGQGTSVSIAFGNDPTGGTGAVSQFPFPAQNALSQAAAGAIYDIQLSSTFRHADSPIANANPVWQYSGNGSNGMANGAQVALYVLSTDGVLRWWNNGTPSARRLFFWIMATASFPNT